MMDLITCAGLGLLESLLLDKLWIRNTNTTTGPAAAALQDVTVAQAACALFLSQYLAVKYYRVFLYHKYFSPLRNVPGPSVSLSSRGVLFYLVRYLCKFGSGSLFVPFVN